MFKATTVRAAVENAAAQGIASKVYYVSGFGKKSYGTVTEISKKSVSVRNDETGKVRKGPWNMLLSVVVG